MSARSEMRYFDSRESEITSSHIMASGALPPAFPAVRIDGELYWDGGILSNTPTEAIFDDNPRRTSLIFAVHMWNPVGPEPETIWQILHRQKDIQYSSRVASHITRQRQLHKLRRIIAELAKFVPAKERSTAAVRELRHLWLPHAHACRAPARPSSRQREPYQGRRFQPAGVKLRWEAGYADTKRALRRKAWEAAFDPLEGVILHELEAGADLTNE